VIEFLEFLTLGIYKFTLELSSTKLTLGFKFRLGLEIFPMLVFYDNRIKGLNKSNVTLLETEV